MADHDISPRAQEELRKRWQHTVGSHSEIADELIARYAQAGRHYHGLEHLVEVLARVDLLAADAADIRAVQLAAWFHDAVYDVHRRDNEEESARLAEARLRAMEMPAALIDEASRLIRLTSTHEVEAGDRNGAVLCDADLAILASPTDRYQRYVREVRREYSHLSDTDFSVGRAHVMRQLLALPRLFATAAARESWETAARANITRELRDLEA